MTYGLDTEDVDKITGAIAAFPEVEKAILYGSRAKGSYREGSDIDISLVGNQLNLSLANMISGALYNLNLPYLFDISIYHQVSNPDLLEHIDRVGITIYERKNVLNN